MALKKKKAKRLSVIRAGIRPENLGDFSEVESLTLGPQMPLLGDA